MAHRFITATSYSDHTIVKVYRDSEFNEFIAKLYINGKHYEPADHYDDDRNECIATARIMAQQAAQNN